MKIAGYRLRQRRMDPPSQPAPAAPPRTSPPSTPSSTPNAVDQVLKLFHISDESLKTIKSHILKEFELGLKDEDAATVKMLITYVRELTRGDETGSYLALDLGGTHFRVMLVEMESGVARVAGVSVHDIPDSLFTTQKGQDLFDYIALKLLQFVQLHKLKRRRISLGFTFSFPCKQYGLTQSVLVKWNKGFNVGGVVGTDVVKQLKDALKRQLSGLIEAYIDVVAVINDTTGTLVACANTNKDCRIGLIVGTGFNACYIERLDRCEKWPANYTNPKQVIVNCEWGAMGDSKERRELDPFRNEFDAEIDKNSVNPNNQTYEKMVSGMYIGELLRLSMIKLYKSKQIFASQTDIQQPKPKQQQSEQSGHHPKTMQNKQSEIKSQMSLGKHKSGSTIGEKKSKSLKSIASPSITKKMATSKIGSTIGSKITSSSPQTDQTKSSNQGHKLYWKDILNGKHLSMLAKDELDSSFEEATKIVKLLNITHYSQSDLSLMVRLASSIMHRSANLVATGISALLERIAKPNTIIGFDGSVIKHHPYFLKVVEQKCAELTPQEFKFVFSVSSDGSGIGAAVVAAALHKERRPLYVLKPGRLFEMHYAKWDKETSK